MLTPIAPWLKAAALAAGLGLALASASGRAETAIPSETPARIEVTFVLDTTGSMAGLIEGAKQKIWSIATRFQDLRPKPEIRFALIGYRDRGDAYVTERHDLTADLQGIYAHLTRFQADGGGDTPESVNQALAEAIRDISWSKDPSVFRVVFLVGDAPPHMDYQDDTPYPTTLGQARQRDIVVNAIQVGGMQETTPVWREIAKLGGGDFAQIAQDGAMVAIETPYDLEIQRLNLRLNETVTPYGRLERQAEVSSKLEARAAAAPSVSADMADYFSKSGGGKLVTSSGESDGGDLVEDVVSGRVELEAVPVDELPEPMQAMTPEARAAYLAKNAAERAAIQAELDALLADRSAYLATATPAESETDAFDGRVKGMVSEQARAKGFVLAE